MKIRNLLLPVFLFAFTSIFIFSCKKDSDCNKNETLAADEYIKYTVNGAAHGYMKPNDTVLPNDSAESYTYVPTSSVLGAKNPFVQNDLAKLSYITTGIAAGSQQLLLLFSTPQTELYIAGAIPTPNSVMVNITEYGPVGQYISGNFTGTFTGSAPGNTVYNVTCSFRVKRKI